MTVEQWLPVPGYEGLYDVSDQGRVRSLDRVVTERGGRTQRLRGRVLKPAPDPDGYLHVVLCNGRPHTYKVHRLVARAFHGEPAPGQVVCHNDGTYTNNIAGNLRWDTRSANNLDTVRHGTNHWASRTHCPQGHAYSPENTRRWRGGRYCRECIRDATRRYKARKRAAA